MKKINTKHDNKDRIICVTTVGKHEFYYQPYRTKERFWLFNTKDFSGSVFKYFRNKGHNIAGRGFCLTIKELYQYCDYRNKKLTRILERIPVQVDYVLKNDICSMETSAPIKCSVHTINNEYECSDECAA